MSRRRRANLARVGIFTLAVLAFLLGTAAALHYAFDSYASYGEALWSGLRHLLDPGSLEDDTGTAERTIGVAQVLAGLVLIVGVLIAVLEEVVSGSLARLTEADPRVRASGHTVIVGWNGFVPQLVRELQAAVAIGGRREVAVAIPSEFRDDRIGVAERLETEGPDLHLSVVTGDPGPGVFDRVSARAAATVLVVPGMDHRVEPDVGDVESIGAAFALRDYLGDLDGGPSVHPALRLGRNLDTVTDRLPASWEPVVADRALGGIAGLAASHPELVRMLTEPFGPGRGAGIVYAIEPRELAGRPFVDAAPALAQGLAVGIVPARGDAVLVPDPGRELEPGDRIAVLARSHDAATARRRDPAPAADAEVELVQPGSGSVRRVLAAGSSYSAHALVEDLGDRGPRRFAVTILSPSAGARAPQRPPPNVEVRTIDAPWNDPERLEAAIRDSGADVVVVSADRAEEVEGDPHALLAALHAATVAGDRGPPVIAQIHGDVDPGFAGTRPGVHVLSRDAMLAKWMTLLAADPISARATTAMLGEDRYRLDAATCNPGGAGPVPFGSVYRGALRSGLLPIGIAGEVGERDTRLAPPADEPIEPGTELVLIRLASTRIREPAQPSS